MTDPPEHTVASFAFRRLTDAGETIAAKVGCSKTSVSLYRNARVVPNDDTKARIEAVYGIPFADWLRPLSSLASPLAALETRLPPEAKQDGGSLSHTGVTAEALEMASAMLSEARALSAAVQSDPEATPGERARVLSSCMSTVTAAGKLLGLTAEIDERKIRKTPAWRRIEDRIVEALRPWPAALRALAEALGE